MPKKTRLNIAELRGILSLLTDATVNVTDLVEDMHNRIVHPPFLPSTAVQHIITGIANIVYGSVKYTTKVIGDGLDKSLKPLNQQFDLGLSLDKKENALAFLNGVIGDYLSEQKNPLAIPMQFKYQGETLDMDDGSISPYPNVNGKILLMVHGLCMNDTRWTHKSHNHGLALANELNMTPLYLYYNGGLHISANGQNLNRLLEELIKAWPVPVEEIDIMAYSMGGLITRSALHYGQEEKRPWLNCLNKAIFLGSPHHGAPLEKIGNYVNNLFEFIPYVKPFTRLVKMRSAGITDLRFGTLVEEDWKRVDRFQHNPQGRTHISLPDNVNCYAVAASKGKENHNGRIKGDGLVHVRSALGHHKDPDKTLGIKESNSYIAYETNHMDLLSSEKVYDQLKQWL